MLKRKLRREEAESEDVNPMEGVANLADVMLVLAVGMMLALVVAWNVDISGSNDPLPVTPVQDGHEQVWDTDGEAPEDLGLTEYGKVYKDEDGNLYILEDN